MTTLLAGDPVPPVIHALFGVGDLAECQRWYSRFEAQYLLKEPVLVRIGDKDMVWCTGTSVRFVIEQAKVTEKARKDIALAVGGGVMPAMGAPPGFAPARPR